MRGGPESGLELPEFRERSPDFEEQFRAEAKLQPGNSEAAYRLGNVLLQQGKMKEAADELRRSNSLKPDMLETLHDLGKALTPSDPNAAGHAFTRIIELEKRVRWLPRHIWLLLAFTENKVKRNLPPRK
jgi:tetratricopeptide (TPR) repeat protein